MKNRLLRILVCGIFMPLFFSACSINPNENSTVTPTDTPKPAQPDTQTEGTTSLPANTPSSPSSLESDSPDGKYTIGLELSETPIQLTVLDNSSKRKIQIVISERHYNTILGDGPIGFKWSADGKVVMFVLYRKPFPNEFIEDLSCFFAVDVEQAKVVTANYSGLLRGLQYQSDSNIAILGHGGLNDTGDVYFLGTNCYKDTLESECNHSYISPSGNWEITPWEESDVTLMDLSGHIWRYSYPIPKDKPDYMLTLVQGWSESEDHVLFSPAFRYGTSRVYGLFQMDLSNGNVISLLESNTIDQPYYLSVSPHATKVFYITPDRKAFIKDLDRNLEKSFDVDIEDDEAVANIIWSPNEAMVIFSRLKLDAENRLTSLDYVRLDVTTGELISLLSGASKYLNIDKITDSEVSIGEQMYCLASGELLK